MLLCGSDRGSGLAERGCEALVFVRRFGAKFVVAASKVLDECVTLDHGWVPEQAISDLVSIPWLSTWQSNSY